MGTRKGRGWGRREGFLLPSRVSEGGGGAYSHLPSPAGGGCDGSRWRGQEKAQEEGIHHLG